MSAEKKEMPMWLQVGMGVLGAHIIYGLLDRFVLSKIANHLENLLGGEENADDND